MIMDTVEPNRRSRGVQAKGPEGQQSDHGEDRSQKKFCVLALTTKGVWRVATSRFVAGPLGARAVGGSRRERQGSANKTRSS
jgi:hypothetical protein